MILIKCCALCRHYKDGKCMDRGSFNASVRADDWRDYWEADDGSNNSNDSSRSSGGV